jgi:hypothetical protein
MTQGHCLGIGGRQYRRPQNFFFALSTLCSLIGLLLIGPKPTTELIQEKWQIAVVATIESPTHLSSYYY